MKDLSDGLPGNDTLKDAHRARRMHSMAMTKLLLLIVLSSIAPLLLILRAPRAQMRLPLNLEYAYQQCHALNLSPGPSLAFTTRENSDRHEAGTGAVLLKNATIWTAETNGDNVVNGDLLLDGGIIKAVGSVDERLTKELVSLDTIELNGAWVTPGIVDMHSHLGVNSAPSLRGAADGNSHEGLVQPWLRSLDGMNTHDAAYNLSISGGVTTALVLPGSANAIGGQGFTMKLRTTSERSPSSMLLEPPCSLNLSMGESRWATSPNWRQMKHACGENPSRVYSGTRMDTIWSFREGYNKALSLKLKQDAYCSALLADRFDKLEGQGFPEDLQWEALVDVLRGRVKVHNHCYEAVDLDGIVRLSNEFKFSIAAFHHAHETWLVPDLLKRAYGKTPAAALFATNARYKREAYRGSEYAPRVLDDAGIQVVMKSDHPVLDSRHLLFEAQQAHYYGLPAHRALAAITSVPAEVMGMDHRVGFIKKGYDADVVVWDSHPLQLGATPKQVYIDGIPQLISPAVTSKPTSAQEAPSPPNFDAEAAEAVAYEGLPPLEPRKGHFVVFANVSTVFTRQRDGIRRTFDAAVSGASAKALVSNGEVICVGTGRACEDQHTLLMQRAEWIDLEGGSLGPGLTTYGSPLGLEEIRSESSTTDGYAPLLPPPIPIRAVDGLLFGTRDALLAHRGGVTAGVVAPRSAGLVAGVGTAFETGAGGALEDGAVLQEVAGVHVQLGHGGLASVSTQIAALRAMLLHAGTKDHGNLFAQGTPLVVNVHSADIIAALIRLKRDVEQHTGRPLAMTVVGGTEAHLLAHELAAARIGVIIAPTRPFPKTWDMRRIMPGPPLSADNAVSILRTHNVTVAIGVTQAWEARNTRLDAAWIALEAGSSISREDAFALASVHVDELLGLQVDPAMTDVVATRGGTLLDMDSKVIGIVSKRRGTIELL